VTKFNLPEHRRCRPWEHRQCLCRRRHRRLEGCAFSVHPKIERIQTSFSDIIINTSQKFIMN